MEKIWIKEGFSRHLECKTFKGWISFDFKWESALGKMKKIVPK